MDRTDEIEINELKNWIAGLEKVLFEGEIDDLEYYGIQFEINHCKSAIRDIEMKYQGDRGL